MEEFTKEEEQEVIDFITRAKNSNEITMTSREIGLITQMIYITYHNAVWGF